MVGNVILRWWGMGNLNQGLVSLRERALGLAICVNTHINRKEEWFQELVQVVEAHRKKV